MGLEPHAELLEDASRRAVTGLRPADDPVHAGSGERPVHQRTGRFRCESVALLPWVEDEAHLCRTVALADPVQNDVTDGGAGLALDGGSRDPVAFAGPRRRCDLLREE